MSRPKPVDQTELKGIREEKAEGTLNNAAQPMSNADAKDGLVYVDVTLPADAYSADLSISYDADALELVEVDERTTAFAWRTDEGFLDVAMAEADYIIADQTVARLTFRAIGEGETTVAILTDYLDTERCDHLEEVAVELEHKCPSEAFVDVNEGDWWHEAVDYVVEKGYMNGMDATHFGPGLTMNRAQFVTVLYRMEGEPTVSNTGVFTDVPAGAWYEAPIAWAVENGVTNGLTATEFGPNAACNRAQVVTFLYRAYNS